MWTCRVFAQTVTYVVDFLKYLNSLNAWFFSFSLLIFVFTNALLQSSQELMVTKHNREAPLIYHMITSVICLGTNNIRIFRDFKILSYSLKFVLVFITCSYTAKTQVWYSYQIATGIIPNSILVWFQWHWIWYEYHTLVFAV